MSDAELLTIGIAVLLVGFIVLKKKSVPVAPQPQQLPSDPTQQAVTTLGTSIGNIVNDVMGGVSST
jgi:hypothetical protein